MLRVFSLYFKVLIVSIFEDIINQQKLNIMEQYIAQIIMFAGNFAPRGWALCDGQLLSIAQNQALFSLLGTTYGGDGRTTFGLPDLRGRVPIHAGTGPGLTTVRLGQKGGSETNQLSVNQLPEHNHTGAVQAVSPIPRGENTGPNPENAYIAEGGVFAMGKNATMAADSVTIGKTGGNLPVNNIQPYQSVNYIIALVGIFPPRN